MKQLQTFKADITMGQEYPAVLVKQSYSGWHLSTGRMVRRCKSRQEALEYLTRFLRRKDDQRKKSRKK